METWAGTIDPGKKVAIVGFADSKKDTPWQQSVNHGGDMEIWGLNELYNHVPEAAFTRWFQLHQDFRVAKRDVNHMKWLQSRPAEFPVYMWQEHEDIPASRAYPLAAVIQRLKTRYFTNSISYMTALAICEGFGTIHIYGVDMAQATEYAHQRPSCEYFIGLAKGLGIEVYIPPNADLCKTPYLYGVENDNEFRTRMQHRQKEIQEKFNQMRQQHSQLEAQMNQFLGAIENMKYISRAWTLPQRSESEGATGLIEAPAEAPAEEAQHDGGGRTG